MESFIYVLKNLDNKKDIHYVDVFLLWNDGYKIIQCIKITNILPKLNKIFM